MPPRGAPQRAPLWRIEKLGEVGSTNDLLLERARLGEPEGLVLWAGAQTSGRGRRGRAWHSPPGRGLYFSALLRPALEPARLPAVGLVAGVAMAEGLAELAGRPVGLKWPNDLRLCGKKLGGILTEFEPKGGPPPAVVVGVGINLLTAPEEFPPDLRSRATSLKASGCPAPEPGEALHLLLRRLEFWYKEFRINGFGPAGRRWMELCDNRGKEVAVSAGEETRRGRVLGIDEAGRLLLEGAEGGTFAAEAGEVIEP